MKIDDDMIRDLHAWAIAHASRHGHPADYAQYVVGTSAAYQSAVALGMRRARKGWSRVLARDRCAELYAKHLLDVVSHAADAKAAKP